MFALVLMLISNVGFIMLLAYVSSRLILNLDHGSMSGKYQRPFAYIVVFTLFAIISNLTGIEIHSDLSFNSLSTFHIQPDAILANTRVLTISVSGLIGGPWVGLTVGLVSGIIRYLQGGYIAVTYLTSSFLIGVISSYIVYWRRQSIFQFSLLELGLLGLILESLQMFLIYLFSNNPQQAIKYIQLISLPMMIANSIGIVLFISLLRSLISLDQSQKLFQAKNIYSITHETMASSYENLTPQAGQHIAQLLMESMSLDNILVLKDDTILYAHHADLACFDALNFTTIHQTLASHPETFTDLSPFCTQNQAHTIQRNMLLLPLHTKDRYLGAVLLIFPLNHIHNQVTIQIAESILDTFTLQLELHRSQQEADLLKDAKIKSLQAQVNPHFLFNAINVIASLCRTQPLEARKQLLQLAHYFRSNIHGASAQAIPISQELQHVKAYLSIQMARFPQRYTIDYDIDASCLSWMIPPFILQMLVENALRHAFVGRPDHNNILIRIHKASQGLSLQVKDNGIGMTQDVISDILQTSQENFGQGTALRNIQQRLYYLYGQQASLEITSGKDGTTVTICLPTISSGKE